MSFYKSVALGSLSLCAYMQKVDRLIPEQNRILWQLNEITWIGKAELHKFQLSYPVPLTPLMLGTQHGIQRRDPRCNYTFLGY